MKRSTRIAATLLALAVPALASAQAPKMAGGKPMMAAPASRQATITGTVIDVSCKFGQGLSGNEHKMCSEICSDRGLPLAILGDDGKLYFPASNAMPGDAQNGKLKPFSEQRVKVSGKVFAAAGAQAIQIATIASAQ